MSARVEIDSVAIRYGEVVAVDGASLTVQPRTLLALLGPSGCGKTSLLRAIAGFERPVAGTIRIDGSVVSSDRVWIEPERRAVGMVFQEGALFPHLDVLANVRYGVRRRADAERRTRAVLELVGMSGMERRFPDELSGGQQQRVALARALAPEPKLVLLDEPFAGLDATLRQQVRDDLRRILRAAGTTAILVTHDQEEALETADLMAVMRRGRILQVGSPREVYEAPASREVADFVGEGEAISCGMDRELLRRLAGSDVLPPHSGAWLFIRPEDLAVAGPGEEGVPAVVDSSRYFGHDSLHRIRIEGASCLLQLRTPFPVRPGETLRVRLRPKRYAVFLDGPGGDRRETLEVGGPAS